MNTTNSIPKPLVDLNQWFIVITVILSWALQLHWLLWIPFIAVTTGAVFSYNPIMKVGRMFLRKDMSSYRAEDADQQRFNAVIASCCLGGALLSELLQWTTAFYLFSGMVLLAASVALAGFCIGCFIRYQWRRLQYKRKLIKE
ncbi:DUF4395 domain-containing protein [Rossellomorea aquimaris]|uniref:DUF4395 domain-containing protein n=1 Tax=Rossellomorea aquimaris TaxID=189382 RepID=UPI001CD79722|nr:DUF4395 domain-containing protein [Rossellomorea aquimaris]MCA1053937.1 DUF4395 domain-containing protein [Rossellomorea aquimaris]